MLFFKASDSNIPKHQKEALHEALETKIVMLMKANSKIKQTEIAKELKVSRATVQRAIQVLVDKYKCFWVGEKAYKLTNRGKDNSKSYFKKNGNVDKEWALSFDDKTGDVIELKQKVMPGLEYFYKNSTF